MTKLVFQLLALLAIICAGLPLPLFAAEANFPSWLASRSAPVCSLKPGVRTSRSDLVAFGDVTASISAQSARDESGSCEQSAAVWVTKGGVSHQFDLTGASANTFSIVDFAPDFSSILLYKEKTFAVPGEDTAPEIALLSLKGGVPQWEPLAKVVGWKGCTGLVEPEGFLGPRRLLFRVSPNAEEAAGVHACVSGVKILVLDLDARNLFEVSPTVSAKRNGQREAGPLLSCQSDPDIAGACYTMRGRVAMATDGLSMLLFQAATKKLMDLSEGMLPDDLSSHVKPDTRVYADMVVCPLFRGSKARPTVCIESATNFQPEHVGLVKQVAAKTAVKGGSAEAGFSH